MTARTYPSNEQMEVELIAAGWKRLRIGIWQAPYGGMYLGPFQAWKAMMGILEKEGIFGDCRGTGDASGGAE